MPHRSQCSSCGEEQSLLLGCCPLKALQLALEQQPSMKESRNRMPWQSSPLSSVNRPRSSEATTAWIELGRQANINLRQLRLPRRKGKGVRNMLSEKDTWPLMLMLYLQLILLQVLVSTKKIKWLWDHLITVTKISKCLLSLYKRHRTDLIIATFNSYKRTCNYC